MSRVETRVSNRHEFDALTMLTTEKSVHYAAKEDKFVLNKLEPVYYEEIPECNACGQLLPDEKKRVSKERRMLNRGGFYTFVACDKLCLARALRAAELDDEDAARALAHLEFSGTKVRSL
jgi:hypothetical protein